MKGLIRLLRAAEDAAQGAAAGSHEGRESAGSEARPPGHSAAPAFPAGSVPGLLGPTQTCFLP